MHSRLIVVLVITLALTVSAVFAKSSPQSKTKTLPSEPLNIQVIGTPDGRLAITWSKPKKKNYTGYAIYRSDTKGKLGELIARLNKNAIGYYDLFNPNTLYYYTVRSIDKNNPKESKNKSQVWYKQQIEQNQAVTSDNTSNKINSFYPGLDCENKGTLKFTASPLPLADIKIVRPTGTATLQGFDPTVSTIIPTIFNKQYEVVSPADARLVHGDYNGATASGIGEGEYFLTFQTDCNFIFTISRFSNISEKLKSVFPEKPVTTPLDPFLSPIYVKSGEPIGTFTYAGNNLELFFKVKNGNHLNVFGNQYRRHYSNDEVSAVCPYNYFEGSLKEQLFAKFTTESGATLKTPVCREVSQDVPGTIRGQWFSSKTIGSPWDKASLSVVTDYANEYLIIEFQNVWDVHKIHMSDPTFRLPEEVTGEHCYKTEDLDRNIGTLYFRVVSKNEIQMAVDQSATQCSGTFPENLAVSYYR